jgi:hypothetical protein
MSDGPHRSLPMPRAWRELARKGDAKLYLQEEVRDAALYALSKDFQSEVSGALLRALRNIFDGVGNSLLSPEIAKFALDHAQHLAAGSVFGSAVVRWCEEYVEGGAFGRDNFYSAVGNAIRERGYAGQRQVQEHYLRESGPRRADGVASKIGHAIDSLSSRELGRSFTGEAGSLPSVPRKGGGIDQGVSLQ